jgi:hypothetical protein
MPTIGGDQNITEHCHEKEKIPTHFTGTGQITFILPLYNDTATKTQFYYRSSVIMNQIKRETGVLWVAVWCCTGTDF